MPSFTARSSRGVRLPSRRVLAERGGVRARASMASAASTTGQLEMLWCREELCFRCSACAESDMGSAVSDSAPRRREELRLREELRRLDELRFFAAGSA